MSDTTIRVAGIHDLKPGQMQAVAVDQRKLMVCNVDGIWFVTDEMCTHEDSSLTLGCLRGEWIKCSLHGSKFNVRTGEVLDEPATESLRTYPVKVEGEDVLIDIE